MSDEREPPSLEEATARVREAAASGRIEFAPGTRVWAHPEVLRRLMACLGAGERFFVSDMSHLWDFVTAGTHEEVLAAVREEFGVELPEEGEQLYLWMVVERLAGARPN